MALTSSLVAMGFLSQTPRLLLPFVAVVLPALFVLGLITVARLIETMLDNQHHLAAIARIRRHYRSIGPEAQTLFSAESGRWPEAEAEHAVGRGTMLGLFGTTATMVAFLNNLVGGTGVGVLVGVWWPRADDIWPAALAGGAVFLALTIAFVAFQRWRFEQHAIPR
jgi:hypothetical protein